ncbi:hypothetical protein [Verminephrobacter eiseniae]|uniref:hypothetical protein n=1 Tax=Verminephrobacter eiseniae TaxID=364317 RepID=UPI002238EEE1|nr:hypothetical protein [Verminephrobacter eiseniae]
MPAEKETASHAKRLPLPKITSRRAVLRAQRHVADSISTLCRQLSAVLTSAMGICPHCNSIDLYLRL